MERMIERMVFGAVIALIIYAVTVGMVDGVQGIDHLERSLR